MDVTKFFFDTNFVDHDDLSKVFFQMKIHRVAKSKNMAERIRNAFDPDLSPDFSDSLTYMFRLYLTIIYVEFNAD